MGQKVKPHGLRVGVIKDWDSKWYADSKNFADNLIEDNLTRSEERRVGKEYRSRWSPYH